MIVDDISGYLLGAVHNVLEGDQGLPAYPCSRKPKDNPPCSTWPKDLNSQRHSAGTVQGGLGHRKMLPYSEAVRG